MSVNASRDPFRALAQRVREVCRSEAQRAAGRDVRGVIVGISPVKVSIPTHSLTLTAGVDDDLEVAAHVTEHAADEDAVLLREQPHGWLAYALLKE